MPFDGSCNGERGRAVPRGPPRAPSAQLCAFARPRSVVAFEIRDRIPGYHESGSPFAVSELYRGSCTPQDDPATPATLPVLPGFARRSYRQSVERGQGDATLALQEMRGVVAHAHHAARRAIANVVPFGCTRIVRTSLRYVFPADEIADVSPASWLFVRGIETIRVVLGGEWKLLVSGPGAKRWSYTFDSDEERFQFQTSLEERLRLQGWALEGYDHDRRESGDRRSTQRENRDRRRDDYKKRH